MSLAYKVLNINDYQAISDEVYQYIVDHTNVLLLKNVFVDQDIDHMLSCCPSLVNFLNTYNLTPNRLATIACAENSKIKMHRDDDGIEPYVRILWPVRNCQGSKTKIWKVPNEVGTVSIDTNGIVYTDFPCDQEYEQIEEFELSSPVLFNASYAHSVDPAPRKQIRIGFNRPYYNSTRISFTIGFDRSLPISKSIDAWQELGFFNQGERHETR
jgi:hypothetical protein